MYRRHPLPRSPACPGDSLERSHRVCLRQGWPAEPRPFKQLLRKPVDPADHKPGPADRFVRWFGGRQHLPTVYLFWILALLLFVAADVVAYSCTT
jgi:hypothetical protein